MWGRGNRHMLADYKAKDIYDHYRDMHKNKFGYKIVPRSKFWKLWKEFIDIRMQLVIFDNLEFNMGCRVGSMRVEIICDVINMKKDGTVVTRTNYGATNKLWLKMYEGKTLDEIRDIPDKPKVFYTNKHVDGKLLKFRWDKVTCNFKNHKYYKFKIVRRWNRMLGEHLLKNKSLHYYSAVKMF